MKRTVFVFSLLILVIICFIVVTPVFSASDSLQIPDGFNQVRSDGAVALYQKNYPNGSPDYVQVADLSKGAQVGVLHGKIVESGQGQGVYGGDNPRFNRKSIQQFWNDFSSSYNGAFCVSNGQFFRLADSPTPLPFSLKVDGQILTDGYGINEFPNQKLMLEIWPDHLDIRDLSQENLYSSTAPDIVAGLTEDAEKASKHAVGRTFVGILDQNGDGRYETFLIFNTTIARPPAAAEVLRSFGAQKLMMLDGGGSTQLVCDGDPLINTDRLIPQAIGIAAGTGTALSSSTQAEASVFNPTGGTQTSAAVSSTKANQGQGTAGNIDQAGDGQDQAQPASPQPEQQLAAGESQKSTASRAPEVSISPAGSPSGRIDIGNAAMVPLLMVPVALIIVATLRRMQQNY